MSKEKINISKGELEGILAEGMGYVWNLNQDEKGMDGYHKTEEKRIEIVNHHFNKIKTKMSEYKLRYEDKFNITGRGDAITVRWQDNNCREIKEGDTITQLIRERDNEVDDQLYEVIGVEMFKKSFDIIGDNMGILIKPINKTTMNKEEIKYSFVILEKYRDLEDGTPNHHYTPAVRVSGEGTRMKLLEQIRKNSIVEGLTITDITIDELGE